MIRAGIDVGSTTVKGVLLDDSGNVLFKSYKRHEARQSERVLELLEKFEELAGGEFHLFMTGSGGADIAKALGVKFVQEVNAVSLAVETLHPDVNSVVELGGQDAKMIFWLESGGKRRKVTTMNDKCAGGTGATIDRIVNKLKLPLEVATSIEFDPDKVHPVAAKCGVFAETDINSLQKAGVPSDELLISLFNAIVVQNLAVLTRGYTLRPKVLLLGGPNTFFPALVGAWRYHLERMWQEKGIEFDSDSILLPKLSQFYAAFGAALYGSYEESPYKGKEGLVTFRAVYLKEMKRKTGERGLLKPGESLREFKERYAVKPFKPKTFKPGEKVRAFLGIDGGSTSTKAVLIDERGELIATAYTLSKGNPLADVKEIVGQLKESVEGQGATLEVLSVGVTGYAKEMLKETIGADVAVVETVAHTVSAQHFFSDIDVIVDVGGQDIKVMMLRNGEVKDFKLNTQCSAGNGYFLQSTAEKFGYRVEEFADVAFRAEFAPRFNFGCAVFLEQDIVNFQRLGWEPHEIMAGLAKVLPKNIWLYVVKEPNLRKLGRRFLLQGGTQKNLAAVKAQYDFIKERVPDAEVFVHPITGEAGAFGAAVLAMRNYTGSTRFVGVDRLLSMEFTVKSDETTRCHFCTNRCQRTFITVSTSSGERTYIIAPCEKGTALDLEGVKSVLGRLKQVEQENPNLQEYAAKRVFESFPVERVYQRKLFGLVPRTGVIEKRRSLKVGIPRVLNFYALAPFFRGYLEALGVEKFIFSDYTSEKLVREELRGGAIDPCFPSKVALAHVRNLLKKSPDVILFPKVATLKSLFKDAEGSHACPTVTATPISVKSVLTKEEDIFKEKGITFLDPLLHFDDEELLKWEMFEAFKELLNLTRKESDRAVDEGFKALDSYYRELRSLGEKILRKVEAEGRIAILVLGRPYHNDPGINHGITKELQKLGYPILTIDSLPLKEEFLKKVFKGQDPFKIRHVWKKAYSENSSRKVWAALYGANHPNLALLDLSSFRCGHDAPIYSVIEEIVEKTGTPYFTFHEIDENRPAGSIKIRVETIDYFLKERMAKEFGTLKEEVAV
ncbi:CoA-substrate-specific enzyme activase [Thermovibrio ammonificans HB-1]|uniref:CoA-substrate-specific enzyme activase n=1 Tax=Thermovibrio ammonificans (strain DSM 15698 / JCM 12110 / HB-1) TaxID=648996 RepID=E8T666_THEA1|nr:BadF/BadG/BcrA/BcrD ATPase family protein [Thermovibrio ammonificans]ADU96650.1 CoA-substrate-specific enzyme activase [Thermovibrio ammonificans HB-1]